MTLENLLRPETYDFREEIISFSSLDDVFTRYIAYKAAGLTKYVKDDNVRLTAQEIAALYPEKRTCYGQDESESCTLAHEIYQTLWDAIYLEPCWKNRDTKLLACDVMNSLSTTINRMIECELGTDEKPGQIKTLDKLETELGYTKGKFFYYPQKKYEWGDEKSILLYRYNPKWFKELLRPAEEFLSVAYTIGNFIPFPVGCNKPRGNIKGYVKDYWDMTLYCIHRWYEDNKDNMESKSTNDKMLIKLLIDKEGPVKNFREWLISFGSWDNFVRRNYMQNFVYGKHGEDGKDVLEGGCFGPPKELWDGHFSGPALPQTPEQIEAFFTHATEAIKARSAHMVAELRKRTPERQTK